MVLLQSSSQSPSCFFHVILNGCFIYKLGRIANVRSRGTADETRSTWVCHTCRASRKSFRERLNNMESIFTSSRSTMNLRQQLSHVKDKSPTLQRSGVIYNVKCKNYDCDYVGETARALGTTLKEDQSRTSAAVHEHCSIAGHSIIPDNVKVTLAEDNTLKRRLGSTRLAEALEIKTRRPSLNRDGGLQLRNIYDAIFPSRDRPEVT